MKSYYSYALSLFSIKLASSIFNDMLFWLSIQSIIPNFLIKYFFDP